MCWTPGSRYERPLLMRGRGRRGAQQQARRTLRGCASLSLPTPKFSTCTRPTAKAGLCGALSWRVVARSKSQHKTAPSTLAGGKMARCTGQVQFAPVPPRPTPLASTLPWGLLTRIAASCTNCTGSTLHPAACLTPCWWRHPTVVFRVTRSCKLMVVTPFAVACR